MTVAVPLAARSPYAVFRSRSFSLLWVGQFVSAAGSALSSLAASILVYRLTGSALSVGLILVTSALPSLALGLVAGVVVDRADRKRLMMVADLASAVLMALVPLMALGIGRLHVPGGIAWLYALTILAGCCTQFFEPAFAAVLPDLAAEEDLAAANALMQISSVGAEAIGFAGAGLIASALPIQWAFYLDALTFLVSAICVGLAALPGSAANTDTSGVAVWQNVRAGARFLFGSRVLRALFLVMVPTALSFGLYNALLLPFSVRALHATSFQFGVQEAGEAIGFAAGSLLLASLANRFRESQLIAASFLGMALTTIVYARLISVPLAISLVAVTGFLNAPSYVGRSLLIQRQTPREMRGRVFSAFFVLRDLLFVVGMAAAGLADVLSVRLLVLASGLALLVSGALCVALPGLRQSAAEWWRATRLLRAAHAARTLGPGRMPMQADVDALIGLAPALAHLEAPERAELLDGRVYQGVPTGTAILRQGAAGDTAYFILAGRVAVGRAGGTDHDDTPLAILNAGDFFGEIAALTAMPRTANVVTDQPSTLLEIPVATLRRLMRQPEVNRLVLAAMTAHLTEVHLRQAPLDQWLLSELRTPPATPPGMPPATPDGLAASQETRAPRQAPVVAARRAPVPAKAAIREPRPSAGDTRGKRGKRRHSARRRV
jgi:CRP-like cAMP-binding protein